MTRYFVGPGGNNSNNGTTWSLRRLTVASGLTLLASGDELRIGPGVYRENPATGVNGTSGAGVISVVGDENGVLTDGVGGAIRITGSNDDQSATRTAGITCANNFWTFRGLHIDTVTTDGINITGNNNIVEQCAFQMNAARHININGASATNNSVRRCDFIGAQSSGNIVLTHSAAVDNSNCIIENCRMIGAQQGVGIDILRYGGVTVRNNIVTGANIGIRSRTLTAGQVNNVNNNILFGNATALSASATTDMTEDYNDLFVNTTTRTNVSIGANSKTYTPLLSMPLLSLGLTTAILGFLDPASLLAAIAGSGVPTDDLFGTARVATSSWGPVQWVSGQRTADAGPSRSRLFGGG